MFQVFVVAVLLFIVGVLVGWAVRSHLAALEKLSATLGTDVTGVLTRVETLLGLIHGASTTVPPATPAPAPHKPS